MPHLTPPDDDYSRINTASGSDSSARGRSAASASADPNSHAAVTNLQESPFAALAQNNDQTLLDASHTADTGLGTAFSTPATDTTSQHGFGSQHGTDNGRADGSNVASQCDAAAGSDAGVGSPLEDRPAFVGPRRPQQRTTLHSLQGTSGPTAPGSHRPASVSVSTPARTFRTRCTTSGCVVTTFLVSLPT